MKSPPFCSPSMGKFRVLCSFHFPSLLSHENIQTIPSVKSQPSPDTALPKALNLAFTDLEPRKQTLVVYKFPSLWDFVTGAQKD